MGGRRRLELLDCTADAGNHRLSPSLAFPLFLPSLAPIFVLCIVYHRRSLYWFYIYPIRDSEWGGRNLLLLHLHSFQTAFLICTEVVQEELADIEFCELQEVHSKTFGSLGLSAK